jgi:hypothetical protein
MQIALVVAPLASWFAPSRRRPQRQPMNRPRLMGLAAAAALGWGLLPGAAAGQQTTACVTQYPSGPVGSQYVAFCEALKERLVGAWSLIAYERVLQDGRSVALMGANPRGMIVLDPAGHFSLILARSDLPDPDRAKTPDDAKAIADGMRASFGTFRLTDNGRQRSIQLHADFPDTSAGRDQFGNIKSLTADEFEYDLSQPFGAYIRLAWKRL